MIKVIGNPILVGLFSCLYALEDSGIPEAWLYSPKYLGGSRSILSGVAGKQYRFQFPGKLEYFMYVSLKNTWSDVYQAAQWSPSKIGAGRTQNQYTDFWDFSEGMIIQKPTELSLPTPFAHA